MLYVIGLVAACLTGYFVYANMKEKRSRKECGKEPAKPSFRTEKSLNSYSKPLDDKHSRVDFDDAE